MSLNYSTFVLGPIENNSYLVWDDDTRQAVVIDPSFEPFAIIDEIRSRSLSITGIWLTHAHFDHTVGIPVLLKELNEKIPVWLHRGDRELYETNGMAPLFGFTMPELPKPGGFLEAGQILHIGKCSIAVRFTPGHFSGHEIFFPRRYQQPPWTF